VALAGVMSSAGFDKHLLSVEEMARFKEMDSQGSTLQPSVPIQNNIYCNKRKQKTK
jgi:hypothetical protein